MTEQIRPSASGGLSQATADTLYAPIAEGVTNGDSHDHSGGDGAQIAYSTLSGLPTLGTAAAENVGAFDAAGAAAAAQAASQPLDTQLTSLAGLSYAGNANKVVRVNAGESGFEVATPTAGSPSGTTVEQDLGSTAKCCGTTTVTDASVSGTSKILAWQAPGPYTGKGTRADEASMQPVQVIAVDPGTGSFVIHWQTPPMITMDKLTDANSSRDAAGATFDRLINQRLPKEFVPRRLGKVRGNIKFTYMVLA